MQGHIKVGREYPVGRQLNTSYSFGLDDQEFVVAFETDDPADFLDLVQRLRTTESSAYTLRDTPTFTCIACSVERALGALDGAALSLAAEARRSGRQCRATAGASPTQPPSRICARRTRCCAALIDELGVGQPRRAPHRGRPRDHYGALVRTIVGQQLSTRAARAIYEPADRALRRARAHPEEILADDPDELRAAAGLSHAKVRYLRSLAEHVLDGSARARRAGPAVR